MFSPHDSASGPAAEAAPRSESALREAGEELERRLREGETARAEEYLARYPALAQDAEQALDLIYVEYATRQEIGQAPTREEFFTRFPQWRAELDRQFQLEELLDEASPQGALAEDEVTLSPPTARGGASAGRFRDLRLLARGGIGQVMRAVDTELNREVAVKELQPGLADNGDIRERFLREAEITGKLEHPGIVPVYGLGRDSLGRPFYAMRLVRGQSFQQAIGEFHQRGDGARQYTGVEFQNLLRRFLHVCETVAFAHSRGIIHRDLKPANILLGPFGETLVVDWGLARATGPKGPQPAADKLETLSPADSQTTPVAHWSNELTQATGELIGTPAFMSPEQAAGTARESGPAGDVYSLGATLYMLLTGKAPFVGKQVRETLERVAAGSFARPREVSRAVPRGLEAVCLKAMARRPEDRYASPRDLASDLELWLADEAVTAAPESIFSRFARYGRRHRTHAAIGAVALAVVAMVSLTAAVLINSERLRADHERVEANRRNARLAFDRGFALTAEHEYGSAMLWFGRALEHAPSGDTEMRRVILTNIHAAQYHLLRRERVFGHGGMLTSMTFSNDGQRLLFTGGASEAVLWDAESGAVLSEGRLLGSRFLAAGFSAGGTALVATQRRGLLFVQPLASDSKTAAEEPLTIPHAEAVIAAAFDPSGSLLGTALRANQQTKLRIWGATEGELIAEFIHPGVIRRFVFPPRADEVATLDVDGAVRLWHFPEKRLVREFRAAAGSIVSFAFTPDGRRLLAGDSVGSVSCWDAEDGRRLFDVAKYSGEVMAVACADDGQSIAAAWDTGTTRTWNLGTGRPASELLRIDRFTRHLAFRPGTRQLIIATQPTELTLWDLPDATGRAPVLDQPGIVSIAFSRDGTLAVTGTGYVNGFGRLRDGETGKSYGQVLRHYGKVKSVAIRPTDDAVVVTASGDGTAKLWKAANGALHAPPLSHRYSTTSTVGVESAAFSPDGSTVATGDNVGVIRTWNSDTGAPLRQIADLQGITTSICFSPAGDLLAASFGAPENSVRVWDAVSGDQLWQGQHQEAVRKVAFSPDGRTLLSGSNDDTARFWDARSGHPRGRALNHRGEVFVVGFSPSGDLAVTGGYDATVRLWSVPAGEPIGEPMRHEGVVLSAAFSPDGLRLLTGSADHSARLWDVTTCLPLSPPLLHGEWVSAVAIHPSGKAALTGRAWQLPAPLPDDPALIDLWVKLATEREFASGESIEWLAPEAVADLKREFESRAGQPWREWGE